MTKAQDDTQLESRTFSHVECQPELVEGGIRMRMASDYLNSLKLFMKNGHHYYVYILECSDGSYYTGVTNNLERRVWEHETGFNTSCYTFKRRPLKLRYCTHLTDIKQAIAWEKQIKGWSRKKKEALFNEDWEEIKRLAQNYTEHPRNPPSTSSG